MDRDSGNNSRVHDPTLRELVAELDGFRELMDERDKRYEERDHANKEAVRAARDSSEKAGEKTDSALKEYKSGANEWRDTVESLISNLRESRSQSAGHTAQRTEDRSNNLGTLGAWLGVIDGLVGIISIVVMIVREQMTP